MATNITNLSPQLSPINGNIVSITLSGLTDRTSRLRINVSSQNNNLTSISSLVIIDTNIAVDVNNQRPWEKAFTLGDDFFGSDLSCDDILDINIEWFDGANGWTQEDNFPTQMLIDCNASQNCSITIEPLAIGVRLNPAVDFNLQSLTIKGTANLCNSVQITITDDNPATYQKTVDVVNNSWEVKFQINDISGFYGKYFTCGQTYAVEVRCVDDSNCSTIQNVQINCINLCSRFASLLLTRLSDNVQISNPNILNCMPSGSYTIAVTDPPANDVLFYEWYKNDVLIPNETGRSIEILLDNQENSKYSVVVITVNECTLNQDIIFSCDGGSRDCVVSDWSSWGPCINNIQTRTRTIITPAANGGNPCPPANELTETRNCREDDVDCEFSETVGPCIDGQQTITRTIITPASNGGRPCPPLRETIICPTPPPTCNRCCWWFIINIFLTIAAIIAIIVAGCGFQWLEPISMTLAIVLGIAALISWILWAIFCLVLNPLRATLCQPLAILIEVLDWLDGAAVIITLVLASIGQLPCAIAFAVNWGLITTIRRVLKGFAQFIGCSLNPFLNR